jgi:hypothetical protein
MAVLKKHSSPVEQNGTKEDINSCWCPTQREPSLELKCAAPYRDARVSNKAEDLVCPPVREVEIAC